MLSFIPRVNFCFIRISNQVPLTMGSDLSGLIPTETFEFQKLGLGTL